MFLTPLMVKPMFGNTAADNKKEKPNTDNKEENTINKPSVFKIPSISCRIKSRSEVNTRDLNTKETSSSVRESVQSLISPKTLLNGTTTPPWGQNRRSLTAEVVRNCPSPNSSSSSLVMCSTVVGRLSNQSSKTGAAIRLKEEEDAELLVETEDRCGSYDDVVLECDDAFSETETEVNVDYVSDFDSGCHIWEESDDTDPSGGQVSLKDDMRETVSIVNNFKTQKMTCKTSATFLSTGKTRSYINVSNHRQHPTVSEPSTSFAVPKAVSRDSRSNKHKTELKNSRLQVQEKSSGPHKNDKTNTPFAFRHKPFIPEKTSTPNTLFARPKAMITKQKETPKSSFTIFTDPPKPSTSSSRGSFCASKSVLSSLSINTLSSHTNRSSISGTAKGGQRITSPLCACGRRAKRQIVSNGGPNHGRGFYCCPVRRSGTGGRVQKGCEFFKWESALMKSSSPAVGSSVSLCQVNSSLSCRPPQRSMIRKSY